MNKTINANYHYNDQGQLHREDGPAVHWNGNAYWYLNGNRHREDGPAEEYFDGSKFWYYNDKFINCNSQEEFLRIINMKAFW